MIKYNILLDDNNKKLIELKEYERKYNDMNKLLLIK